MKNNPVLLCDFGGTHVRLGVYSGAEITNLHKYKLADFKNHIDLFAHYKVTYPAAADVYDIAVAAAEAQTQQHFSSGFQENSKISKAYFTAHGYELVVCLNDFAALAWGAADYAGEVVMLRDSTSLHADAPRIILGPGTGIGSALILGGAGEHVTILPTSHAAHVAPCTVQAEQAALYAALQAATPDRRVIYEELALCGRALETLYRHFTNTDLADIGVILDHPQDPTAQKILRLAHEFFGLFIQNTVISHFAYGGIILNGGLLDALYERDLFDFERVLELMAQPYYPVVRDSLAATPVTYIKDTYLALYGLQNYLQKS